MCGPGQCLKSIQPCNELRIIRLVTIDHQRDVEPLLQRSRAVLQHHRVQPGILFTNVPNLQSVIRVYLQLLHLELRAVGDLLAVSKPARTHTSARPSHGGNDASNVLRKVWPYHCVSGVGKADTFTCNLKDFWPAVTSTTGPFLLLRLMNGFSERRDVSL